MDMPRNLLKQALLRNELQVGVFLGLANPLSAEIMAGCGFDFLMIDAEHGPNDVRSVLGQLQAMAAYPVNVLVRPPNHDPALIKQLLGAGVQTLLVPMVNSAEQAQALVAAVRYPPVGMRGVGTGIERGARWNGVENYFVHADNEMCLMTQVESKEGLNALDEILGVDGVDGVFLGPSDLAASLGHLGQPGHPEVRAVIEDALARIAGAGKIAGVFSTDVAAARSYHERGACFIAIGVDTLVLRNAALKLASEFKGRSVGKAGASY